MSMVTPDAWIERRDDDNGEPPDPDDVCMVCDRHDCVCPPVDDDATPGDQGLDGDPSEYGD